jgi:hypothetical protein
MFKSLLLFFLVAIYPSIIYSTHDCIDHDKKVHDISDLSNSMATWNGINLIKGKGDIPNIDKSNFAQEIYQMLSSPKTKSILQNE